jgi:hypothetical protein
MNVTSTLGLLTVDALHLCSRRTSAPFEPRPISVWAEPVKAPARTADLNP